MGKQDIVDFLEKNKGRWFSTLEMSKRTGLSRGTIVRSVRSLRQGNEVLYKTTFNHGPAKYIYSWRDYDSD